MTKYCVYVVILALAGMVTSEPALRKFGLKTKKPLFWQNYSPISLPLPPLPVLPKLPRLPCPFEIRPWLPRLPIIRLNEEVEECPREEEEEITPVNRRCPCEEVAVQREVVQEPVRRAQPKRRHHVPVRPVEEPREEPKPQCNCQSCQDKRDDAQEAALAQEAARAQEATRAQEAARAQEFYEYEPKPECQCQACQNRRKQNEKLEPNYENFEVQSSCSCKKDRPLEMYYD